MQELNISIVLYRTPAEQLQTLLSCLLDVRSLNVIYLIDNSPQYTSLPSISSPKITYIPTERNLGYGAGHNIAIEHTIKNNIPYHLVLNSDISLRVEDIDNLLSYLKENPEVGQLMPKVLSADGSVQQLCKLLPTPFDLFIRRFVPKRLFTKRRKKFVLDCSNYNRIFNPPYLSGCFMFLRTSALKKVGLFDTNFFMYPEDIDLTRRIHRHFQTIFYPYVTITHQHTQASYKSLRMMFVHAFNIIKYFNKYGWFSDKERDEFNRRVLAELNS